MEKLNELLEAQKLKFANIDKNIADFRARESEIQASIREKELESEFDKYSIELVRATSSLKHELKELRTIRLQAEADREEMTQRGAKELKTAINHIKESWEKETIAECDRLYLDEMKAAAAKVLEFSQKWVDNRTSKTKQFVDKRAEFKPFLPTEGQGSFFSSSLSVDLAFEKRYDELGL